MPVRKQPPELSSWKEISDYLGVSVRTAQTWEREKGLPLHRMPGGKSRVRAYPGELDSWKAANLRRQPWWLRPHTLRGYACLTTVLLLALAAHEFVIHCAFDEKGPPAQHRLVGQSLIVSDSAGNELWRTVFSEDFESGFYAPELSADRRKAAFVDLDGLPGVETLFIYNPVLSAAEGAALICFSEQGKERWRFTPEKPGRKGDRTVEPPCRISNFLVTSLPGDPGRKILVTFSTWAESSTRLVVLKPSGSVAAEYRYDGAFDALEAGDADGCGSKEVLLGGVDGKNRQATLLLLSLRGGSNGHPGGNGGSKTTPVENTAVVFPRTCINCRLEPHNRVCGICVTENCTRIFVTEREIPESTVAYCLGRDLSATRVWVSDSLRNLHYRMESEGLLDHDLSEGEIENMRRLVRCRETGR